MNETNNNEKANRITDRWFHFLYIVIWPFFCLFRPIRAIGKENIPDGPAVLCPNHSTIGDPFYVTFGFGYKHVMRALAKIQIMRLPFIGWILGKGGVFGVDRDTTDLKAVKSGLKCLKDGRKLLLFPEGTRVRDGMTVEPKTGAALFATRTNSPLLPIWIPRKKKLFRFNTIVIGKPYYPEYEGRKPSAEDLERITKDLMVRINKLGEGRS